MSATTVGYVMMMIFDISAALLIGFWGVWLLRRLWWFVRMLNGPR